MDVDDQQECQCVSEGVPSYRWRIKVFRGCTFMYDLCMYFMIGGCDDAVSDQKIKSFFDFP